MHCNAHVCNDLDTDSRCSLGCLSRGGRARRDVGPTAVSLTASLSYGPLKTRLRRGTDSQIAVGQTEKSGKSEITCNKSV